MVVCILFGKLFASLPPSPTTLRRECLRASAFSVTMVKTLRASRNKDVVRGVGRYGRSNMYHKRGLWAIKDKNGGSFPRHEKTVAAEVAPVRAPKFYPADDVPKPLHKNKVINPPKLRRV